jgi:glycosyltransferase involved in cell wall biosynthesis
MPVATVLMLAYNHSPYIRQSIESIVNQKTSFPFELIIGEDCSTDDTRKIVLDYGREYPEIVRAITSERNVGGRANLRRVEEACRGEYVAYCEGDDYWHEQDKLQRQITFLESHPDYALVHSDFRTYNVQSGKMAPRTLGLREDLDDADAFNDIISGRRIVFTLTACMPRAVLETVLRECRECYDPRFLMGDTQRWLEIARKGKVKYFSEVQATRRILPESASQSRDPSRVLRFALSAKDVLDHYIGKYGCSPEAKKGAKTRCAFSLLSAACAAGNVQVAKGALDEYRKVDARIPLQAYLYYFGSKSAARAQLIRPALATTRLWNKVSARAARLFK